MRGLFRRLEPVSAALTDPRHKANGNRPIRWGGTRLGASSEVSGRGKWSLLAAITSWRSWTARPQNIWVRKVLFQIHLWTGVTVCLYVAVVSISGGALVFRRELSLKQLHRKVALDSPGRPRLSTEKLEESVQRAYPGDEILTVIEPHNATQPYRVVLAHGKTRFERLYDPYTGANLGDPRSVLERALGWLADLHDDLLAGGTGRVVNGVGATLVVLLSVTGGVARRLACVPGRTWLAGCAGGTWSLS